MKNITPNSPEALPFDPLLINAIPGNHLVLLPNAPTFTIAAVSDECLTALSLQRESLVGYGVVEVLLSNGINQAVAQQFCQSLIQVLQTKQAHQMADLRYERTNAQTLAGEGRAWRVVNKPVVRPQGELLYIVTSAQDISTEVQLIEIAQANQYLQAIINLFQEPMQVLQPVFEQGQIIDFCFTLTNQAYAAYANSTPYQLRGKRVSEVFPGYTKTVSFTNPVQTYWTGQPLTFDIHYNQDGLDLYNVMSTAKLGEEVVVHFTDFTRLRQLQNQLESKIEELSRSNESLRQFAYIASHDLQEPLRKIQQFGDLLRDEYAPALGEGEDYLGRMQSAASRMSRLIQDLLAYSRISTGQPITAPVSLTTVVSAVLADLELRVQESGAVVELAPLPTVFGDATQLGQLFQNLLANALKFRQVERTPVVTIGAHRVAARDLPPSVKPARMASHYHRLDVVDNGIGFDPRYVDRIFKVFQRLHGKGEFAGTGIGLAICEKVAVNHGGAITASSQSGQGATFSVYLPDESASTGDQANNPKTDQVRIGSDG